MKSWPSPIVRAAHAVVRTCVSPTLITADPSASLAILCTPPTSHNRSYVGCDLSWGIRKWASANGCQIRASPLCLRIQANCESARQGSCYGAPLLCARHVGSAYGRAFRTRSRRLANHCRIRANPFRLRVHASCESPSQGVINGILGYIHCSYSCGPYIPCNAIPTDKVQFSTR